MDALLVAGIVLALYVLAGFFLWHSGRVRCAHCGRRVRAEKTLFYNGRTLCLDCIRRLCGL